MTVKICEAALLEALKGDQDPLHPDLNDALDAFVQMTLDAARDVGVVLTDELTEELTQTASALDYHGVLACITPAEREAFRNTAACKRAYNIFVDGFRRAVQQDRADVFEEIVRYLHKSDWQAPFHFKGALRRPVEIAIDAGANECFRRCAEAGAVSEMRPPEIRALVEDLVIMSPMMLHHLLVSEVARKGCVWWRLNGGPTLLYPEWAPCTTAAAGAIMHAWSEKAGPGMVGFLVAVLAGSMCKASLGAAVLELIRTVVLPADKEDVLRLVLSNQHFGVNYIAMPLGEKLVAGASRNQCTGPALLRALLRRAVQCGATRCVRAMLDAQCGAVNILQSLADGPRHQALCETARAAEAVLRELGSFGADAEEMVAALWRESEGHFADRSVAALRAEADLAAELRAEAEQERERAEQERKRAEQKKASAAAKAVTRRFDRDVRRPLESRLLAAEAGCEARDAKAVLRREDAARQRADEALSNAVRVAAARLRDGGDMGDADARLAAANARWAGSKPSPVVLRLVRETRAALRPRPERAPKRPEPTDELKPPDELTCAISFKLLLDPVGTSTGFCFDRGALSEYISLKDAEAGKPLATLPCPLCASEMSRHVVPCFPVRSMARAWLQANPSYTADK